MKKRILNESLDFISPLISVGRGLLNSPLLINTYLKGTIEYPFNVIYFLFKIKNSDDLMKIETIAKECPNYVECFDLTLNRYLYVFAIPDFLHDDFYKILEGKFSKISNKAKKLFPKYEYFKNEKGEYLRDQDGQLIKTLTPIYSIIFKEDSLIQHWSDLLNIDVNFFIENDIELYENKNISEEKTEFIIFKTLDK